MSEGSEKIKEANESEEESYFSREENSNKQVPLVRTLDAKNIIHKI
jgi:hypothetical protein